MFLLRISVVLLSRLILNIRLQPVSLGRCGTAALSTYVFDISSSFGDIETVGGARRDRDVSVIIVLRRPEMY